MIKVVGLQRSGTNYLTELLKENFKDDVAGYLYPFWKHSLPNETKIKLNEGGYHTQPKPIECNCQIVLIYKPFDIWFKSVKRNQADLKIKRPEVFVDGKLNEHECFKFHSNYHFIWFRYADYKMNYITLLEDYDKELSKLSEILNIKPNFKSIFVDVKKVPHSKEFTEEKRKYYLDIN